MFCPDPKASTVSFKLRYRLTYQNYNLCCMGGVVHIEAIVGIAAKIIVS